MQHSKSAAIIVAFIVLVPLLVQAQEHPAASAEELAKKLSNPVASLISVPLQNNTDYGIGPHNGSKNTLNIQPVVPFKISKKINLIARIILPVVSQRDVSGENKNEDGLSDVTATAFFAPSSSKALIWAVGPAFLIPTGTNDFLTTKKWGVGPSALLLKQAKGFTFGFLVNQIWSFAGSEERPDVNQMFLQPFLVHNWKSGAGLGINAEITQNWAAGNGIAFINPSLSGVTKLGKQTVSLAVGPRIPVSGPAASKPDLGFRATFTLVFPK